MSEYREGLQVVIPQPKIHLFDPLRMCLDNAPLPSGSHRIPRARLRGRRLVNVRSSANIKVEKAVMQVAAHIYEFLNQNAHSFFASHATAIGDSCHLRV